VQATSCWAAAATLSVPATRTNVLETSFIFAPWPYQSSGWELAGDLCTPDREVRSPGFRRNSIAGIVVRNAVEQSCVHGCVLGYSWLVGSSTPPTLPAACMCAAVGVQMLSTRALG